MVEHQRRRICSVVGCALLLAWTQAATALEVRVLDGSSGDPLPEAEVRWRSSGRTSASFITDSHGCVRIVVPPESTDPVQVTASQAGYTPLSMTWERHQLPTRFEFALQPTPWPEIPVAVPTADKPVRAAAVCHPPRAAPGDSVFLLVRVRIASGHHIYALDDSGCSNLPTALEASPGEGLEGKGPWRGPAPKANDDGSRTLAGEALFRQRLLLKPALAAGQIKVPVKLRFQVCNEAVCWPPATISLDPSLNVVTSGP